MTKLEADCEKVMRTMSDGAVTANRIAKIAGLKPGCVRNVLCRYPDKFHVTGKMGRENIWQLK